MLYLDDTLAVVRSQSDALIRAEVKTTEARAMLDRACYEAVTKLGCTVAEVAVASDLSEREVQRIIALRRRDPWALIDGS